MSTTLSGTELEYAPARVESRADQERAWVAAMKPGQEHEHRGILISRHSQGYSIEGRTVMRDAQEAIACADRFACEGRIHR